jgi:hypothetical protein
VNIGLVLDTAALLAYAEGDRRVGPTIAKAIDRGEQVLIPSTCLAIAYRDGSAASADMLDLVAAGSHAVVTPFDREHCAVAGGWARVLGLDTAHAAMEATANGVVPLMTDKRDLVTQFLAKEWPIIDI